LKILFNKKGLFLNEKYPVAEKLARNGFYLPSGLSLNETDVKLVVTTLKNILIS